MIYHLSLQTAGLVCGVFLLLLSGFFLVGSTSARAAAGRFPRSKPIGVALLTIDLVWCFWLLATMEMGEFSVFRRPLFIMLPIAFLLVLFFVDEFLAVRALGILCLLAAEPLLDAAFLRYEMSRLFVTVFAYVLVVLGLLWVTMPYLLRDQIRWSAQSPARWRIVGGIGLMYAVAILACAFTQY